MNPLLESHKPENIKILFIAEAPGFNGSGKLTQHFYFADNNLFRTIFTAFEVVYGSFDSAQDFLTFFKSIGCYLDHLSVAAINRSDKAERKIGRQKAVPSLVERLKSYKPEMVIVLMKEIQKQVVEAVEISGIDSVRLLEAVPYPAGSDTNRKNCIAEIASLLRNLEVN
ncbi:uracil-DNA glycosylase family protein [Persicitalea jodogahamensis]|uniref:Uracil-DNA glycosylase-like domain-containing protein n=1 Tax=Persicitalea jodogahamensis TaxID=402147 RepID=A0A8J3D7H3_9BACT|nr:uracil-DNA glycosylase family protein [Persicitalea jodogahamensis]GHB56525.1 hypothetical protein GCM10007390_07340 [Persicitalea jodogahamensis]